jgi:hypothetical protein
MRRNNIELRPMVNKSDDIRFEIVKWQPNLYYGKEQDYILYDANDEFYVHPIHNCRIHKNCFKNPETCFTLMFIYNNGTLKFIGNRPMELDNITEYIDMLFLIRKGIKQKNNNKIK